MYALTQGLHWLLFDAARIELRGGPHTWTFAAIFVVSAAVLIFVLGTIVAGRIPRPNPRRLLVYMAVVLLLGVVLEILINSAAEALIGRKSWEYMVWPRHGGHNSGLAIFAWPLYGAHLCLLEDGLRARGLWPKTNLPLAMVMAFDAMVMEVVCNVFSITVFGTYYFYYLAPDLKHFTTGEIYIPYVLSNLVVLGCVHAVQRARYWWLWCVVSCVLAVVVLFYVG